MNKIYQLLLVGAATLVSSAYGQGFYTTYQVNDPSYDTGFIQTDAIGYPGSGPCGSLSLWNQLNGEYQSGWAPGDLMDVTFAYDSTDYPWSYGYSYQYMSPYGYCVAASFTFSSPIGFGSTTSRTPYQMFSTILPGRDGPRCVQITDSISCTNTSNPKYPVTSVVEFPLGVDCPEFFNTLLVRISGLVTTGISSPVYGPGYCTPIY